jgi:hypothetical protein
MNIKKFLFLFLLLSLNVFSNDYEVISEGTSVIDESKSKAKDKASFDAKKTGLKKALYSLYDSSSINKNSSKINEFIYKNPDKYITSVNTTKEYLSEKIGIANVELELTIDLVLLKNDLIENGIILKTSGNKTILSLIYDKDIIYENNAFIDTEKEMIKIFNEKNYLFINKYENEMSYNLPSQRTYMGLTKEKIKQLSKLFNVDIVLVGFIKTNCKENEINNESICESNMTVKAFSNNETRLIAFKNNYKKISSKTFLDSKVKAKNLLIKDVSEDILNQIEKNFTKETFNKFTLVFKGIKNYKKYRKIKNDLLNGKIKGLINVSEKTLSKNYISFKGEIKEDIDFIKNQVIEKYFEDSKIEVSQSLNKSLEFKII